MYKTKDGKILCIWAIHHKDGFNTKAEWHSSTSHSNEPCDGIRGTIKIFKSRASLQHPMQDKILTKNNLYQWPQGNFQLNVTIQWLELFHHMLLSCTEKETVSFCFKKTWHNHLEEISNIKKCFTVLQLFLFLLFLFSAFQIVILFAVSYFALFPIRHIIQM